VPDNPLEGRGGAKVAWDCYCICMGTLKVGFKRLIIRHKKNPALTGFLVLFVTILSKDSY
jgi:hypothetical protein